MRLEPIEKPKGLKMRLAFWMARRQFGKVMTPMKVVTARMPRGLRMAYEIVKFETKGIGLEPELHYLVVSLVSKINECAFCLDLARAATMQEHLSVAKLDALEEYRSSSLFSQRERAALAYAEEATRDKRVSDETFEALRAEFSDEEIVEIVWINAIENYYNLINRPLEIESDGFCALVAARQA